MTSSFPTGFSPRTLAYADLDGDGVDDLAAANPEAGTLTVLWGSSSGFGTALSTWSVGGEVADITVADLNGDGLSDLATALPTENAVAVLLGEGSRSFRELQLQVAGSAPRSVLAANLDAEGPPELITANTGDGSVSVVMNLAHSERLAVGPGPGDLAAGDLNGDGNLDLVVALSGPGTLQVLFGDRRGKLSLGPEHLVGSAPQAVVAADFDADGALDLASASAFEDTVSVLFGDNNGGVRERKTWSSISQPSDLAVVPNGAGMPVLSVLSAATSVFQQLDPVSGSTISGTTSGWASAIVARSDGSVNYGSEPNSQVGRLAPGIGLQLTHTWQGPPMSRGWPVDLDGDGLDELLLAEKLVGPLQLWRLGPGSPSDVEPGLPGAIWGARADDVTGDASIDVVVWGNQDVAVLQQDDDGRLVPGPPMTAAGSIIDIALGDADGDGQLDVLVLTDVEAAGELQWLTCDAEGVLQTVTVFSLTFIPASLQVVEGGGDLRVDLIFTDLQGQVYYLEDGTEPIKKLGFTEVQEPTAASYGDIDLDGDLDAIVCGSQGLAAIRDILAPVPEMPEVLSQASCDGVELADLDGDGSLDAIAQTVIERHLSTHSRTIFTPWIQGAEGWTRLGSQSVSDARSYIFAHLSGDEVPDIAIIHREHLTDAFQVQIGAALVETDVVAIDSPVRFRLGDVDGDGTADLVGIGSTLSLALSDDQGSFGPLQQPLLAPSLGNSNSRIEDVILVDTDVGTGDTIVMAVSDPAVPGTDIFTVAFAAGTPVSHQIATLPAGDSRLQLADLDRDGFDDIVVLSEEQVLSAHVLFGQAQGGFGIPHHSTLTSPAPIVSPHMYDVDRDGKIDLVGASSVGVIWFRGQSQGEFEAGRVWSPVPADDLIPSDFDGDGAVEFVLLREHTLSLLRTDDEETPAFLQSVTSAMVADLDADGRPELLATTGPVNLAGPTMTLHVGHHDDVAGFQLSGYHFPGWTAQILQTADVDGDADLDIVIVRDSGLIIMRQNS